MHHFECLSRRAEYTLTPLSGRYLRIKCGNAGRHVDDYIGFNGIGHPVYRQAGRSGEQSPSGTLWVCCTGSCHADLFAAAGYNPLWLHVVVLLVYGIGAGSVLVALHRTAMVGLSEEQTGTAAGVYGTIRFTGAAVGTALAGVMLQSYLNQQLPEIEAYQNVFFWFTVFPLVGIPIVFGLREPKGG